MLDKILSEKLTDYARRCIDRAFEIAVASHSLAVEPHHFLKAIYDEKGSLGNNILTNLGFKHNIFKSAIAREIVPDQDMPLKLSSQSKKIITKAFSIASHLHSPYVGTEHLAYSILDSKDEKVLEILNLAKESGLDKNGRKKATNFKFDENMLQNLPKMLNIPDISLSRPKKSKQKSTPFIEQFCVDLNREVKVKNEMTIGREKEITRIANILGRRNKNNPVLIGEPGVGKTAIVMGLAERINSGLANPTLINKEIRMLDMASVVAGTSFRGEFEARLKKIIEEASQHKNIILFIDELHSIVGAGNASGGLDAANILKPALSRGIIQCIGATTIDEYKKHIEKDPALERRFQPVMVAEPSLEETIKIIDGIKSNYEKFHNVSLSAEVIESAAQLSARYLPDRRLPDKAIDLIDEAAAWARNQQKISDFTLEIKKKREERERLVDRKNELVNLEDYEQASTFRQKEKIITEEIIILEKKQQEAEKINRIAITSFDIANIVSQMTGIPAEKVIARSTPKIKHLEKNLNQKVIGQKKAIGQICQILNRSFSGIAAPGRPLGSFLILGPTGVGKTLTAKTIANELFESEKALIRIDMSEFMERHSVAQLIGAPAGYVGFGEGGRLTEKVRRNPYSLVLFDEIEKAHPDIFNILLQILEEGSLTDAEGRYVSFKNTIIILTSNIGTSRFTQTAGIGFSSKTTRRSIKEKFDALSAEVITELKKQMKPELLNRLDNILVFEPLDEKTLVKIAKLELDSLSSRLSENKVAVKFDPRLPQHIAKLSHDVNEGARLIRKNIQNLVENKIADWLIRHDKFKEVSEISVGISKGQIAVSVKKWKKLTISQKKSR